MFFKFKKLKKLPSFEESKNLIYLLNTTNKLFLKIILTLRTRSLPHAQFSI